MKKLNIALSLLLVAVLMCGCVSASAEDIVLTDVETVVVDNEVVQEPVSDSVADVSKYQISGGMKQVVADNDLIYIEALSADYETATNEYCVELFVQNRSNNYLTFTSSYVAIDGYQVDSYMYSNLVPGRSMISYLEVLPAVINAAGVEDFGVIDFDISVYDETYTEIETISYSLTVNDNPPTAVDESVMDVLLDDDTATVKLLDYTAYPEGNYIYLNALFENKTDSELEFIVEHLDSEELAEGAAVSWYNLLPSGSKALARIPIDYCTDIDGNFVIPSDLVLHLCGYDITAETETDSLLFDTTFAVPFKEAESVDDTTELVLVDEEDSTEEDSAKVIAELEAELAALREQIAAIQEPAA